MAQAQPQTQINNIQQLIALTQSGNLSMHHFQSGDHHYILLGHTWVNQACDIIHYKGYVHKILGFIGIRMEIAQREQYSRAQFQVDINHGLCMVNKNAYPRNSEEIAMAWSRWLEREGEKRNYMSASNSKQLVKYLLTGFSHPQQIAEIKDVLICELNEILLKGIATLLMPKLLTFLFENGATEMMTKHNTRTWPSLMKENFMKMFRQPPKISIPHILKNYIERTFIDQGIRPEEIFHNQRLLFDISMQFWGHCEKIVACSLLFSIALEIISIIKLWCDKKLGRIPNHAFKREWVKSSNAMLCAILGTFVGCLFGFRFFKPLWKPFVLGFILNICSRIFGRVMLSQQ